MSDRDERGAVQAPPEVAAFCREVHPRLVGALGLYLGDRAVAEELAQEALLRAADRWERVGRLDSPAGWTYRVAMNLANSWFRRRRAEARARQRRGADVEVHVDADVADRETVRQAVAALPERQRRALVLRYFLDLSVAATAAQMQVSDDAIRSLTKRALAQLRESLAEDDELLASNEVRDA